MDGEHDGSEPGAQRLDSRRMTWAALLGRWVDFARSALALPDDEQGRRLRRSVPDIIMLQALWCALRELEELEGPERALGLDRSGVLIDKHAGALERQWSGEAMPSLLLDLIRDAREQWQRAAAETSSPTAAPGGDGP